MPKKAETVILHDFGKGSTFNERTRFNSKGGSSSSVSINIEAEPLVHTFSEEALGAGPSEAMLEIIRDQMRSLGQASPETLLRRERAAESYKGNFENTRIVENPGATKARYSSGRGKSKTLKRPDLSSRLFADSNILYDGIQVRQVPSRKQFIINVTKNRLTETHFAERLGREVRAIGRPSSILTEGKFIKAVDKSINLLIAKAEDAQRAKTLALRQQQLNAARALVGLLKSFGGL